MKTAMSTLKTHQRLKTSHDYKKKFSDQMIPSTSVRGRFRRCTLDCNWCLKPVQFGLLSPSEHCCMLQLFPSSSIIVCHSLLKPIDDKLLFGKISPKASGVFGSSLMSLSRLPGVQIFWDSEKGFIGSCEMNLPMS